MSALRSLAVVVALAGCGCTFSPGDWFANLEPTFEGRYVLRPDRNVTGDVPGEPSGDGWQKLNTLYEIKVTRAVLTVREVELHELDTAAQPGTFDPSRPPPGYSLCHNGHCHRDDGALVPYDVIAAELAGSGASQPRVVATLPVGEEDLLSPARRRLSCEPRCGLPLANVQRARATVTAVAWEGVVRDRRVPARLEGELPWRWDTALGTDAGQAPTPVLLDCALDLPADRAHPPNVSLDLSLQVGARLFDDLDWSTLERGEGVIDFGVEANAVGRDRVHESFAETEIDALIKRRN